jgi:hypothetical protein
MPSARRTARSSFSGAVSGLRDNQDSGLRVCGEQSTGGSTGPGNELQRWLRDQKLRAGIDFIGATGDLYDHRRQPLPVGALPVDESAHWSRAQDGRSALHLLCDRPTIELTETLIASIRLIEPTPDGGHSDEVLALLRDLVRRLRTELGA